MIRVCVVVLLDTYQKAMIDNDQWLVVVVVVIGRRRIISGVTPQMNTNLPPVNGYRLGNNLTTHSSCSFSKYG